MDKSNIQELKDLIDSKKHQIIQLSSEIYEDEVELKQQIHLQKEKEHLENMKTLRISSNYDEYRNKPVKEIEKEIEILKYHCQKLQQVMQDKHTRDTCDSMYAYKCGRCKKCKAVVD
jgi:hypothetical protein